MKSCTWSFDNVESLKQLEVPGWCDSSSVWISVFFDSKFSKSNLFQVLKQKFPQALVTGCSTSGEISGNSVFDKSISVSVLKFEKSKIKPVMLATITSESSFEMGQRLAENLSDKDLKAVMVFSQGLNVNGSELAKGLSEKFRNVGLSVVVSGGLAGDGDRFSQTTVFCNDEVSHQGIVAIGLSGPSLIIKSGFSTGWEPFGPERQVTRSQGNILYEIDGQKALSLYKNYLGKQAENLPSSALYFPLMIKCPDKVPLVRTILSIDEKEQSLIFAGDIPQNAKAQLMRTSFQKLLDAAEEVGQETHSAVQGVRSPHIFAISCVGRKLVLGQRVDDEVEAFSKNFPTAATISGFYSYGELAPTGFTGCELHNQTMTLTVIDEAA
jgi:hypothetical protein